jgi:hypothetical protein
VGPVVGMSSAARARLLGSAASPSPRQQGASSPPPPPPSPHGGPAVVIRGRASSVVRVATPASPRASPASTPVPGPASPQAVRSPVGSLQGRGSPCPGPGPRTGGGGGTRGAPAGRASPTVPGPSGGVSGENPLARSGRAVGAAVLSGVARDTPASPRISSANPLMPKPASPASEE